MHKFYLGEIGWGIIYAIFFWTYIPTIAGFVEFILLLNMQKPEFDRKYNNPALLGYNSRQITNQMPPQVIVNIGEERYVSTDFEATKKAKNIDLSKPSPTLIGEQIDRRILKFCQQKHQMTLLDCFLEIEDVPRSVLEARLEILVRQEFLQIDNRAIDGKVIYRLDN